MAAAATAQMEVMLHIADKGIKNDDAILGMKRNQKEVLLDRGAVNLCLSGPKPVKHECSYPQLCWTKEQPLGPINAPAAARGSRSFASARTVYNSDAMVNESDFD